MNSTIWEWGNKWGDPIIISTYFMEEVSRLRGREREIPNEQGSLPQWKKEERESRVTVSAGVLRAQY